MRASISIIAALAGGAVQVSAEIANVYPSAVRSQTPGSCSAAGGVGLVFDSDFKAMRASFPQLELVHDTPSHNFPVYDSIMDCQATVSLVESDFGSGTNQYRFAITNVTYTNDNLTLPEGADLTLTTSVDLSIEVSNITSPVSYPIGYDLYAGNLINLKSNPGGNSSHSGPFSHTVQVADPVVYTPCFLGREYHTLNFDLAVEGITVDGGVSSAGWNVDFGLDYQACEWTPESDNWGTTQIRGWEQVYYHTTNQTVSKRGLPGSLSKPFPRRQLH